MFHRRGPLVEVLLNLLLHLRFHLLSNTLTVLNTHLNYFQSVPDESSFDLSVDLGVGAEAGSVVDFEHPWFELGVEHDVEAEQLKAAVGLLRLATAIDMLQLWLHRYYSLHHDCFNLVPDLSSGLSDAGFAFFGGRLAHDTFEAVVQSQLVRFIAEVRILLIQTVVG